MGAYISGLASIRWRGTRPRFPRALRCRKRLSTVRQSRPNRHCRPTSNSSDIAPPPWRRYSCAVTLEQFKKKAKKIPDKPGVYFFLDTRKKVLYIGKAASLRDRVRS